MERKITINDTLDERAQSAKDEVKEALLEYLKDNPDTGATPEIWSDLDYSGRIHEIIDSNAPIYHSEIRDAWYLYSDKLEEAYKNAGVGENPRENDGMSAIYFYIEQQVSEWYNDHAEDIFNEWQAAQEADQEADG